MKRYILTLGIILTVLGWGYSVSQGFSSAPRAHSKPLHIALVGPFSGPKASSGQAMLNGAQIYIDSYNASLFNGERPLSLTTYDDKNDPKKAVKIARKIASDGKTIAVLGHRSSNATLPASEIYNEAGIPMVAGTATDPMVTRNKPWIFRVVPDNALQGRFVARAAKANGIKNVSIIYDTDNYGRSLLSTFKSSAKDLNLNIIHELQFDATDQDFVGQAKRLTHALSRKKTPGIIFLAVHDNFGTYIVRTIRDQGKDWKLIGSASIGKQTFPDKFEGLKKEKDQPGYYTDNLYALSSLIFDVAGEMAQAFSAQYKARFGAKPDSAAAAYHDAAKVIAEAVGAVNWDTTSPISQIREDIRSRLTAMDTASKGIQGVTGLVYFDFNGNVDKSVHVGQFKKKSFISAPVQLKSVQDPRKVTQDDLKQGRILKLGGNYFYKTQVVYTGISPINYTDFDQSSLSYHAEFLLWFRGGGNIQPNDIIFKNAIGDVVMGDPIEQKLDGDVPYRLYRVKGRFKIDAHKGRDTFGEYGLSISFRHASMLGSNLIYVADVLGMNGAQDWQTSILTKRLFDGTSDWAVTKASIYQDSLHKSSLGHPDLLSSNTDNASYSQFNLALLVKENKLHLRGVVPETIQSTVFPVSLLLLLALFLLENLKICSRMTVYIWALEMISWACVLSSGEAVILSLLAEKSGYIYLKDISTTFDVLWWMIGANFLQRSTVMFIWDALQKRSGRKIPRIVRNSSNVMIYTLALLGVLAFVFTQDLTKLLATSGLLAMIIGLAVQPNLVNIFSGIAISLEKSFKIGDFVKINVLGSDITGQVIDMNWRTTKVETGEKTIISIPNAAMANTNINNLSTSDKVVNSGLTISFDRRFDPQMVMAKVKDAGESIEGATAVSIKVKNVLPDTVEYGLKIVHNTGTSSDIVTQVWHEIWLILKDLDPSSQQQFLSKDLRN